MDGSLTVPADLDAERGLLGVCLVLPDKLAEVAHVVDPSDFYSPAHQAVFAAAVSLHQAGHRPDPVSVRDESGRLGYQLDLAVIRDCISEPAGSWRRAAETVTRTATARRALDVIEAARTALLHNSDPGEVIDSTRHRLADLDNPLAALPAGFGSFDEFMAASEADPTPWTIPGCLRLGQRAVIVAEEGAGKSILIEQITLAAAAGVHPFTFKPTPPVVALHVDLENDDSRIRSGVETVEAGLRALRRVDGGAWLWREPAGIDLRRRKHRMVFEAVLSACRPELVCLGPIYKSYTSKASEPDERVAAEVQAVLDDLRSRFGFSLILEHHAPHGDGMSKRKMRPYGSSLWLRWPEFGIALNRDPDNKESLTVGRWRGDRVKAAWPERLDKGGTGSLPWVGYWKHGYEQF